MKLTFDRRVAFWVLFVPPLLWLGLFFVAPLVLMAIFSFSPTTSANLLQGWIPSLKQYTQAVSDTSYWRLLGISVVMALIVAVISILLSYPIAYFLAFRAGKNSNLFLVLLLIPFWTSYLLRVMAWKFMLGSEGLINSFLEYVKVIQQPLTALLYNRSAVVVTLIYVWIPFSTLPILAALQRIDLALFEAASDLGATPFWQFMRVTLPLSLPGVLAAFFMVFIPTVGEYVTPLLVGGSRGSMYGNIIQLFFTEAANWPFGSALSMIMLSATMIMVLLATRLVNLRELLE
jgi:spermidine/putrescine transport system permease protein